MCILSHSHRAAGAHKTTTINWSWKIYTPHKRNTAQRFLSHHIPVGFFGLFQRLFPLTHCRTGCCWSLCACFVFCIFYRIQITINTAAMGIFQEAAISLFHLLCVSCLFEKSKVLPGTNFHQQSQPAQFNPTDSRETTANEKQKQTPKKRK